MSHESLVLRRKSPPEFEPRKVQGKNVNFIIRKIYNGF